MVQLTNAGAGAKTANPYQAPPASPHPASTVYWHLCRMYWYGRAVNITNRKAYLLQAAERLVWV